MYLSSTLNFPVGMSSRFVFGTILSLSPVLTMMGCLDPVTSQSKTGSQSIALNNREDVNEFLKSS